jgi:hypothetical protein
LDSLLALNPLLTLNALCAALALNTLRTDTAGVTLRACRTRRTLKPLLTLCEPLLPETRENITPH